MGASGGFPIDLILFGMIAAFLVLRLRGILGKRTGFERPAQAYAPPTPAQGAPSAAPSVEPTGAPVNRTVPEASTQIGQTLLQMRGVDRSFDAAGFLGGAEQAFRMIVSGFAAGDRVSLRSLLSDDTYKAFEEAIASREAVGHTQISEIKALESMSIEGASLRGSVATITVRIVSDQTNLTTDKAGHPVIGTDAVTEITDIWTFERDLAQRDPTWRLIAARSA